MKNEEQTQKEPQTKALHIADVMGSTPKEKWENLKRYIIEQTDKIDKETEWRPTEPEWWLEMSTIARNTFTPQGKTFRGLTQVGGIIPKH